PGAGTRTRSRLRPLAPRRAVHSTSLELHQPRHVPDRRPTPRRVRVGAYPLHLPDRSGAADARKRVELVAAIRGRGARGALRLETIDVAGPRLPERLTRQVGDDVVLVEAVLGELTTGREPAMAVDVDAAQREGVARRLLAVERRAVGEPDPRPAAGLARERTDLLCDLPPLRRIQVRPALQTPGHRLRQDVVDTDAPERLGELRRFPDLVPVAAVDHDRQEARDAEVRQERRAEEDASI